MATNFEHTTIRFSQLNPDLLAGSERARAVSENTMLIEEFVLYAQKDLGAEIEFTKPPKKVLLHGHCHQKALVGTGPAMQVLKSIPGCDVREIQSGCCGMAGSFGMEKEHYEMSMSIGEMALFPAIRDEEGEFEIVAEGISCRQQIQHGTEKSAMHLVELLADAM